MEGEKGPSSINKISGGTVAQREAAKDKFAELFSNPDRLHSYEREKTSGEKEIIDGVISQMRPFLEGYGAQSLLITEAHIHILDEDKLSESERVSFQEKYASTKGFYRPQSQDIWLFNAKMESPLMTATILAHELIHFAGFNAIILNGEGESTVHRIGLAVQDPKVPMEAPGLHLFNETNEATTEGLVKRFFPRLKDIPILRQEYEEVERAQKKHDDLAYVHVVPVETDSGPMFEAKVESFGYPEFRRADRELFKQILNQHPDEFTSEDEVFDIFAHAAMTGDVKRMASLVESLGRGSFRALAHRKTQTETTAN